MKYPELYKSANEGSKTAQDHFLWTIRAEYFVLFCVSVAGATKDLTGISPLIIFVCILILSGLLVFKVFKKLDQVWYRCRALAESIKTSTWRFCMRAHPFENSENIDVPVGELRNLLRDILRSNQGIAESLHNEGSEQITSAMLEIRGLSLNEIIEYYIEQRIDDQRAWYSKKSKENKKALRFWVLLIIAIYVATSVTLFSDDLGLPLIQRAFDPLLIIVTSMIGWIQIKRHGELISSYNLTAQEIGIIRGNSASITSEEEFSDFVNEAELAFSREQ